MATPGKGQLVCSNKCWFCVPINHDLSLFDGTANNLACQAKPVAFRVAGVECVVGGIGSGCQIG